MSSGGLSAIARVRTTVTRSISPENPTGAAGGGARATTGTGAECARDLEVPWKVSASVIIAPNHEYEVAAIDGPGLITHLWMTTHPTRWRSLVLRAWWDGDDSPAIEVPLGDFFCQGWGQFAQVSSATIAANPHGGLNSYWPMPFRAAARLTVTNVGGTEATLYYQLTYEVGDDLSADFAYLHAQWRRSNPTGEQVPHVLVEGIEGTGHYVGTYLAWGVNSPGWWGEGEIKFYLDGDGEYPTICGTGTEDYFGGAWNFDVPGSGYTTFTTPYLGMPQVLRPDGLYASQQRFGMYRWHLADPIRFASRIGRVEIQALGWRSDFRYLPLRDDVASTALFYLDRTSTNRPAAPTAREMEVHSGSSALPPPS